MSEHYDFHYQPTGSGAISGQQVLQQTEDAINELGDYVNDNVGGAMDVAQQALETAQNAETNAQTALDTANSFSSAIQSAQQDASTALSTAQTAQTTASNANNTAIQAQQDANTAVTTANNASGQVNTLSGTVTTLGQRVTTAEGNIGQNTSDITALTTRVGTAEGNITTLQNDVSVAMGNASSAMTTAGQVKQQAYVFRYSSTALTASSTNSNTLLDNTDNLKVGDKVIDSDGVLFSITAIDSVNSTFTVGSALVDLALDGNVVHTSGNEDVNGIKTFKDMIPIDGDYLGNEASTNQRTNICLRSNRDTADKSCAFITRFRQNRAQGALQFLDLQKIGFDVLENEVRTNNVFDIQCTDWLNNVPQRVNFVSYAQSYSWGRSTNKSLFNELNPSALSMPDLANGIDISSYFDLSLYTGQTYTPTVNGWISISITSPNRGSILCESTGISQTAYGVTDPDDNNKYRVSILIPCQENQTLTAYIMASGGTVNFAKFFPCQGNV